ncbi:MAG: HAD family phosphatase [Patescibacteria group bacterium]|jgi:HAD superfamily hydrolase (TIGR01509 family)
MIKAIVFDLDGVLIDSEPLWEQSTWEYLKKKCGPDAHKKFNEKELDREVRGRTQIFISRYLKKHLVIPDPLTTIINDRLKILLVLFNKHLKLAPGAISLLKHLQQQGYPMLIATSGPRKVVNYVVRRFHLKKYFQAVISGDEMKYSKPHPWVYKRAARILHIKSNEMLVIEDSISGVLAGIRSGAKVIALKKPYTPTRYTRHAIKIVRGLSQITIKFIQSI